MNWSPETYALLYGALAGIALGFVVGYWRGWREAEELWKEKK